MGEGILSVQFCYKHEFLSQMKFIKKKWDIRPQKTYILGEHKLLKLSHEEIENLNKPITGKQIELAV
jgi:hypothetical protein